MHLSTEECRPFGCAGKPDFIPKLCALGLLEWCEYGYIPVVPDWSKLPLPDWRK